MNYRNEYKNRVRQRSNDQRGERPARHFVVAPELNPLDLALLFRALGAYEDALDSEMLTETDTDKHRAEKRDARELATWLQNAADELWRYNDADAWTTCEGCKQMVIPILEMGAPEFCDDCAAQRGEE